MNHNQFSRTKALWDEYSKAFKNIDTLLLLPPAAVREEYDESFDKEKFLNDIKKESNVNIKMVKDYSEARNELKKYLNSDTIVVTVGATPVYKITDDLYE